MRGTQRRIVATWVAILSCAVPAAAWAQASATEKAAAEALFDAGRRLLVAGDFAQACEKLERSQAIDPGIGTMLYLADCYEKLGRTASAWATFREAASAADAAGQSARAESGAQRAAALRPRLSTLTVAVDSQNVMPGFVLKRGDDELTAATWGTALPVDPGEHEVVASAPGYASWRGTVTIQGEGQSFSLNVPALLAEASTAPALAAEPAAAAPPVAAPPAAVVDAAVVPAADGQDASWQRPLGIALGAVGLAGLGVGAYLGVTARSIDRATLDDGACEGTRCDRDGAVENQRARNRARWANVGYGAGALALGAGILTYALAPDGGEAASARARLRVEPAWGRRSGGFVVSGAF